MLCLGVMTVTGFVIKDKIDNHPGNAGDSRLNPVYFTSFSYA